MRIRTVRFFFLLLFFINKNALNAHQTSLGYSMARWPDTHTDKAWRVDGIYLYLYSRWYLTCLSLFFRWCGLSFGSGCANTLTQWPYTRARTHSTRSSSIDGAQLWMDQLKTSFSEFYAPYRWIGCFVPTRAIWQDSAYPNVIINTYSTQTRISNIFGGCAHLKPLYGECSRIRLESELCAFVCFNRQSYAANEQQ